MTGWRWMGWRARPRLRPVAAPPPTPFDAVISLGSYNLPDGVAPARAVVAVRQAVNALPGAGWISVEHHAVGGGANAVAVTPAAAGAEGAAVAARVEAAVARALAGLVPAHAPVLPVLPGPVRLVVPMAGSAAPAPGPAVRPVPMESPFPLPPAVTFGGLAEPPARVLDALAALDELASLVSPGAAAVSQAWDAAELDAAGPDAAGTDAAGLGASAAAGDVELLAALLGRVLPDPAAAAAAARHAVAAHGSYAAVLAQPPAALLKVPGLGPHSAAAIKLVHEAALRLARATVMDQPALRSFDALIPYLTAVLAREPLEHFRVLFLDGDGRIRADEAQARGTVNHTPVYPREVARRALELDAASVILVHNHPSGDPSPSVEDGQMTGAVQDACGTVGVSVQDHIIVGNGRWFSFRREGRLGGV